MPSFGFDTTRLSLWKWCRLRGAGQRATAIGRVLLTQDADFLEIAAQWQRQGIAFGGILFAPQGTPIGRLIDDVELCLAGMTANEFANRLVHLPLR